MPFFFSLTWPVARQMNRDKASQAFPSNREPTASFKHTHTHTNAEEKKGKRRISSALLGTNQSQVANQAPSESLAPDEGASTC